MSFYRGISVLRRPTAETVKGNRGKKSLIFLISLNLDIPLICVSTENVAIYLELFKHQLLNAIQPKSTV